ncbi:hypothetical protein Rumeso_00327 [Rubellimicrobium mesophilum DSM 19309]|uniref:Uncharacterized protein n=1 Tax=Rubellimicrobium mesophilum DSM 19309 TaxID=442562 RepID=A0A017HUP8_9RHOB|nr:hypothetical protein [Rubellimicrobium mesophilum]EYD78091.1 hypothetical protein Rumeso_00327 [Rubellimicrobium mesophilum DSM 19309]
MNVLRSVLVLGVLAAPALAHDAPSTPSDPTAVTASRAAAEAFYDIDAAVAAGYEPLFDCTDHGTDGAMGQHYINPDYAGDGRLVVDEPDVLMYEPQPDGAMHLVALEYIVFQAQWTDEAPPTFLGQTLQLKSAVGTHPVDPFYELHVWHWRSNPSGMTADYNPSVTCSFAG